MKYSSRHGAKGPIYRGARRAGRAARRFRPAIDLGRMEARALLAIGSVIASQVVTMSGDSAADTLVLSKNNDLLQHNTLTAPPGQGYADNLDFDSTTPNVSDQVIDGTDPVIINGAGTTRSRSATPRRRPRHSRRGSPWSGRRAGRTR